MNEDTINDLKQFISATVSQQFAQQNIELEKRFEKIDERFEKIDERFEKIENKIDDLSASVADALDNSNNATQEQLNIHEQRITKLEHSTI